MSREVQPMISQQSDESDEEDRASDSDDDHWQELEAELIRVAGASPVMDPGVDKVAFAQAVFHSEQDAEYLEVKVLRFGPADRGCIVELTMEKGSLGPGDLKGSLDRKLYFDANQREQTARVETKDNDTWDGIRQCPISLSVVQGVRTTIVDERGKKALILVSDSDTYPDDGKPTLVNFLQAQRKIRGIKLFKSLAALTVIGIHSVVDSYILKIVVDTAVKDDAAFAEDEDRWITLNREHRLILCAAVYLASYMSFVFANMVFKWNRGYGGTEAWLRKNLYAKFEYLALPGASKIGNGRFADTAIFQVQELTKFGWKQSHTAYTSAVTILGNVILSFYLLLNKVPAFWATAAVFGVLLVCGLTMCGVYVIRDRKMQSLLSKRQNTEDDWIALAGKMMGTRQLVYCYHAVEAALTNFNTVYERFHGASRDASTYQLYTQLIPGIVFAFILAGVYGTIPILVRTFSFGAGDVSSLVKSMMKVSSCCTKLYSCSLNISRARIALEKIAETLNLPDRVLDHISNEQRENADRMMPPRAQPTTMEDLDFIRFQNVSFSYAGSTEAILSYANLEINCRAGGLWLLMGPDSAAPSGQGRRTTLRLLATMVHPTGGRLTMPSFRRVVYVDRIPNVIEQSVKRNLWFGREGWLKLDITADKENKEKLDAEAAAKKQKLTELTRCTAQACGMSKRLYESLDTEIGHEFSSLTTVDAAALMLARAFLSEADAILVDHIDGGSQHLGELVGTLLRRYASGGLRQVLQESGVACPADILPPAPKVKPIVIWSPLVSASNAAGVIKLSQKQLFAGR